MTKKYSQIVNRLTDKITKSKTDVPGFIVGLSGTDSIVAFMAMWDALAQANNQVRNWTEPKRLIGVHFVKKGRPRPTWFQAEIVPWLKAETSHENWVDVLVVELDENEEIDRFYNLQKIAHAEHVWVAAAINATEKRLGKYTILAKAASIWPIASMWKTDVLDVCAAPEFNIPAVAVEMARLPDCLCGRDELAAANLELIDAILRNKVDFEKYDVELVGKIMSWVHDIKQLYDFKERTPYLV